MIQLSRSQSGMGMTAILVGVVKTSTSGCLVAPVPNESPVVSELKDRIANADVLAEALAAKLPDGDEITAKVLAGLASVIPSGAQTAPLENIPSKRIARAVLEPKRYLAPDEPEPDSRTHPATAITKSPDHDLEVHLYLTPRQSISLSAATGVGVPPFPWTVRD